VRARATLVQQHKIGAIAVEAVVDRGRDAAKARLGSQTWPNITVV
jgi:hypothetical protein